MFCIKCGKTLDTSVDVCPDCGTKVVLPEGFDPNKNDTVKVDIDMLIGEKTVSADHSALVRKAVAAANANTAPEATAAEPVTDVAPVAPTVPVMQDAVPHSPAGFDLKSVKKTMNGRSILIDDSPLPGTLPAYLTPVPVQAIPSAMSQVQMSAPAVAQKPQDKKTLIIIIVAAVLGVALIAVILAFFLSGDKDNDRENEEKVITASATEIRTEAESKKSDKEDFISDKTGVNSIIGSLDSTDGYFKGDDEAEKDNGYENNRTELPSRRPPTNRPTNPFNSSDSFESADKDESEISGSLNNNTDESVGSDNSEENNVENDAAEENNGSMAEIPEENNNEANGSVEALPPSIND
ncbi:MAG: hypothetical protein J6J45_03400 [Clostridia bacterium]|nr:hypothetical protein [Clostridia bacterium]